MGVDKIFSKQEIESLRKLILAFNEITGVEVTFIIEAMGQDVIKVGEVKDLDVYSLGLLLGGNMASLCGLAKLLSADKFDYVLYEANQRSVYCAYLSDFIIVAVFKNNCIKGKVRYYLNQLAEDVNNIIKTEQNKEIGEQKLNEITQKDIDELFS